MKFSLSLRPMDDAPVPARKIAEYGALAESLGYHAIYATDHFYITSATFHSTSVVAVLAGATDRIKLGFSAYQAPLRHPIAVAKEFSMLDALSGGRLIAGLAAGSYAPEFEAFGVPFKRRGAMLEEALQAITLLWTKEAASFKGEFWSFDDVRIVAKPVQKPHPPIWLGTWTAVPRAARRVAKYAAGWQASGLHTPVEAIPEGLAQIEKACAEFGRNPGDIGKVYVNGIVNFGATPDKAWEEFTRHSNRSREKDLCFMGDTKDIVARVAALRAAGMDEISFLLGVDAEATIRRIAEEVMPEFR
jgi:probable F420-dependent oxidoreductase